MLEGLLVFRQGAVCTNSHYDWRFKFVFSLVVFMRDKCPEQNETDFCIPDSHGPELDVVDVGGDLNFKRETKQKSNNDEIKIANRKKMGKSSTTMGDDTHYSLVDEYFLLGQTLESCFAVLHKMLFIFPSSQDLNLNRS